MPKSKLPPYGAELLQARRQGRYVNPWLFGGAGAWDLADRRGPGRIVLPAGEDPHRFDWRCVAGLDVVVLWHEASTQEADALGALLVRAGATTVNLLAGLLLDPASRRHVIARAHRRYVRKAAA